MDMVHSKCIVKKVSLFIFLLYFFSFLVVRVFNVCCSSIIFFSLVV